VQELAPLPVALPLFVAAVLVGLATVTRRGFRDLAAVLTARPAP